MFRAFYFGTYDTVKAMFDKPHILTKFAIAQTVTVFSVSLAYPFDTVRRRLMMMSGEGEKMYRCRKTKKNFISQIKYSISFQTP